MTTFEYPQGATPIDLNEAEGLLLNHITTREELDRWEQDNILDAHAWLDKTKPTDILNEQFVRGLHKRMFGNVWRWAGKFRTTDKNVGGPWQQISVDLQSLFDDALLWIRLRNESPEEIAVRFHHRLVSIHPFPNGNGRHARIMADILLENILHGPRFSWGGRELSSAGEARNRYIAALHEADNGNYQPLLTFARS
jgi:Fic-DOC domain mobile mystery protein B